MPLSPSEQLTAQFYEWEVRGRGWQCAGYPAQLEPPFHPFFRHRIATPYIDDGRRPTLLSRLADVFRTPQPIPDIAASEPLPTALFPFVEDDELKAFAIRHARHSKPSVELMEQCLVMLTGITAPISFEIITDSDTVTIQFVCRQQYAAFLFGQLKAFLPDVGIVPVEIAELLGDDMPLYTADFGLQEECMRPINTMHGHGDSLVGFWGVVEQLQDDEKVLLQVLFAPTVNQWADSLERAVSDGIKGSFFFDAPEMPGLAKEKCMKPLFAVTIRAVSQAATLLEAQQLLQQVAYTVVRASTSPYNALVPLPSDTYTFEQRIDDIELRQSHRAGMLLNSRELATFVHLPASTVSKKLIGYNRSTKAAPYHLIDAPYCLGINSHQGTDEYAGIGAQQRLKHLHLIGATGMGKSTLLHSLIMQDVLNNEGLCVIDPHGDLIDKILNNIPHSRINDVVLIDPADSLYPIGLNILSAHSDLEKELLASDLVALFRRFSTSWGDQMNSVFANAVSAFVYNSRIGTLADMRKFFVEQSFRNTILSTCTDPDIAYYWRKEYPLLKSSSVGSILTRLDSFLRPKVIRSMVAQQQSVNFQALMDTKKIVLVRLSQGLLGEENSYLLGAFIVSKLQQIAMARQAQATQDRIPFYCYIDEFQHFITPSMATILSGARKYGLGLILAHQDMQQVQSQDATIASSLLSNAGTRICFKVGDNDAKRLQEGFSAFGAEDLQNLGVGEAVVRVNANTDDFNVAVIPYPATDGASCKEDIIKHSRSLYSVPVASTPQPEVTVEPIPSTPPPQPIPIAAPKVAVPPTDAPQQKEIREHRYLQAFIKKLAEEHGYKANMEVRTPDGAGQVDVLLEREGAHIAVEISVTTSAAWELHNIQKCLTAGYAQVAVCASSQAKMQQIQSLVLSQLSPAEQHRVRVLTAEQIPMLFMHTPMSETTTHKGYRVKVLYEQGGGNQSEIIQRIIASKKVR